MPLNKDNIGIAIPYFNASKQIIRVIEKATQFSNHIVVINDCSKEDLPQTINQFKNVKVLKLDKNLGVGGATIAGFDYLKNEGLVQILIKLDADDQMDTAFIPLLTNEIDKGYGFVKGNRFRDLKRLKEMPAVRRFGNFFLSFLSKVATGYWNVFDFNNGFIAISSKTYAQLDVSNLKHNYFFETSLISELYYYRISIKEIAMPAIYNDEKSNMKLIRMPLLFFKNLIKLFFKRIYRSYFVYDFNIGSIYLLFGSIFMLTGLIFGGVNWYSYASQNLLTPLGTIMISTLLIIFGFQLLLQLIQFDIINTPKDEK